MQGQRTRTRHRSEFAPLGIRARVCGEGMRRGYAAGQAMGQVVIRSLAKGFSSVGVILSPL
jgi:hypothetical protein